MCYSVYLSTTSTEDLSKITSPHFKLKEAVRAEEGPSLDLLEHPHKWYLVCRYGGCSCYFRHLETDEEPYFWAPQDWYPEDADDLESTAAFYDLIVRLIAEGHQVDVIDQWESDDPGELNTIPVSLNAVPRETFRFIADHRFVFGV